MNRYTGREQWKFAGRETYRDKDLLVWVLIDNPTSPRRLLARHAVQVAPTQQPTHRRRR